MCRLCVFIRFETIIFVGYVSLFALNLLNLIITWNFPNRNCQILKIRNSLHIKSVGYVSLCGSNLSDLSITWHFSKLNCQICRLWVFIRFESDKFIVFCLYDFNLSNLKNYVVVFNQICKLYVKFHCLSIWLKF